MIALLVALACGTERVAVKQLRDAPELAQQQATVTTVAALRKLPPIRWHNAAPRTPPERRVVGVAAWLVGYKLEDDQDWHVVIADKAGRTMIAEFVDPECATSLTARLAFTNARRQFRALVEDEPTKKFRTLEEPVPIAVAGVVFMDHPHGQTGGAPNSVEMHPVLYIAKRAVRR